MRTVSKTPYEIRLDLLILAKEILTEKHSAAAGMNILNGLTPGLVVATSPTTEEIIAEAARLNGFVSHGYDSPTN